MASSILISLAVFAGRDPAHVSSSAGTRVSGMNQGEREVRSLHPFVGKQHVGDARAAQVWGNTKLLQVAHATVESFTINELKLLLTNVYGV